MKGDRVILVTGAGGFIGHHLAKYLVQQGFKVRGVDIKRPEYEPSPRPNSNHWTFADGIIAFRRRGG